MSLLDVLPINCIRAPLNATDKRGVIHELVDVLAQAGRVTHPEQVREAVWTREQTRTTGIGSGLAIPHGKSSTVRELAIAVGKPSEPIEFEAIDGQPVQLIFLLVSPLDRTSDHIQALAKISRLISQPDFRERIYAASTSEAIYEALRSRESLT